MKKGWVQVAAIGVAGFVVIVAFVEGVLMYVRSHGVEAKPNCYETTVDISRTLTPIIQGPRTHSGLYACGMYSRPALPDVIRCYELKEGCAE